MHIPIAYTYEADVHCPACCRVKFGDEYEDIPDARDSEGNPIGALFGWDEWYDVGCGNQTLSCGDCGKIIDEYE
jgi:hypothetical protein